MEGKKQSHRPGLFYCNDCKGQFTVTVGTVFERSKVPLTKWWMAAHMLNSGKKGVSAHEIHRTIGRHLQNCMVSMMHRLREAMSGMSGGAMGGSGTTPFKRTKRTTETPSKRAKGYRKGHSHKAGIIALVEPKRAV